MKASKIGETEKGRKVVYILRLNMSFKSFRFGTLFSEQLEQASSGKKGASFIFPGPLRVGTVSTVIPLSLREVRGM